MKKNLNIAYLNGAEGMIRKSSASSGGSGEEDNIVTAEFYSISINNLEEFEYGYEMLTDILQQASYIKCIVHPQGELVKITNSQSINLDVYYAITPLAMMGCNTLIFDNNGNKWNEGSWKNNILKVLEQDGANGPYDDFFNKVFTIITKEEFYNLET